MTKTENHYFQSPKINYFVTYVKSTKLLDMCMGVTRFQFKQKP